MADTLNVSLREQLGTSATKKLRREGFVPANVYGHGKENMNISIPADQWGPVVQQGTRIVTLEGAVNDTAMVSEVQWDTFGTSTLHVALIRVSADERVEAAVKVELKGDSIGSNSGGIINHVLHEIQISCRAIAIPDSIIANISELNVGGQITDGDLSYPEGTEVISPAGQVVVLCTEVASESDEDGAVALPGEPEVIGQKPDEEGAE